MASTQGYSNPLIYVICPHCNHQSHYIKFCDNCQARIPPKELIFKHPTKEVRPEVVDLQTTASRVENIVPSNMLQSLKWGSTQGYSNLSIFVICPHCNQQSYSISFCNNCRTRIPPKGIMIGNPMTEVKPEVADLQTTASRVENIVPSDMSQSLKRESTQGYFVICPHCNHQSHNIGFCNNCQTRIPPKVIFFNRHPMKQVQPDEQKTIKVEAPSYVGSFQQAETRKKRKAERECKPEEDENKESEDRTAHRVQCWGSCDGMDQEDSDDDFDIEEGDDDDDLDLEDEGSDDDDEEDDEEDKEAVQQKLSALKQNIKQKTPVKGNDKDKIAKSLKEKTPKKELAQKAASPKQNANGAQIVGELERRREKDTKMLFVGGLPKDIKPEELKALSGDIIDIRLPNLKKKSQAKTQFAFLAFNSEAKAESNYKTLQSKKLRGQPLTLDFFGEKSANKKVLENNAYNKKKLFVSRIPVETTIDKVAKLFPMSCQITFNQSPIFRTAAVLYETEELAKQAYESQNGSEISGHKLVVLYCKKGAGLGTKRKHNNDKTEKLTFLIESMSEDQKNFFQQVFPGIKVKEVDQKTANAILVKSTRAKKVKKKRQGKLKELKKRQSKLKELKKRQVKLKELKKRQGKLKELKKKQGDAPSAAPAAKKIKTEQESE